MAFSILEDLTCNAANASVEEVIAASRAEIREASDALGLLCALSQRKKHQLHL